MDGLFRNVLELSYTGSKIIIIVLFIRLLLTRFHKKYAYYLWLLPAIRLCIPVKYSGIWGVISQYKKASDVQENISLVTHTSGVQMVMGKAGEYLENWPQEFWQVLSSIWIAGVVILFIGSIIKYSDLCVKLRTSIRFSEHIYLSDNATVPFVMGIFSPRIYLPSGVQWEKFGYIIEHEEVHRKRHDNLIKILGYAIAVIHWFNPMVWLAFYFFDRDMEMSCDEIVTQEMPESERKKYALALIAFAKAEVHNIPVAFSKNNVKKRIKNVVTVKRKTVLNRIVPSLVVILAFCCLLANFESTATANFNKMIKNTVSDIQANSARRDYGYPAYQYAVEVLEDKTSVELEIKGTLVLCVFNSVDDSFGELGNTIGEIRSFVDELLSVIQDKYPKGSVEKIVYRADEKSKQFSLPDSYHFQVFLENEDYGKEKLNVEVKSGQYSILK